MITPRMWTVDELERDRLTAIAAFRRERLEEPWAHDLRTLTEWIDATRRAG